MVPERTNPYSVLWSRSRKLFGETNAERSQDYVLTLLFVKYAGDRFADLPEAPIVVPRGASFRDLVALKGRPELGRRINEQILAPLAAANGLSELPDFNDASLFGVGREAVDRLTELIALFECAELDYSLLRPEEAEDPLVDAYEHLRRYVAVERRKRLASRGVQSYVPAEVSRVIARVLGLGAATPEAATAYDPVYSFGSPLVALHVEAHRKLTLYAQAGADPVGGPARLHLRLHGCRAPQFAYGNAFAAPQFLDGGKLKTFDFVVANPPLDNAPWLDGGDPMLDPFKRFQPFGAPPERRSSYAYLLHVVQSLNATGRGACVLPLRVLSRGSRGDSETEIRWALVRKGLISGIIALPANLFFGTGVAMGLVIVDRRGAYARKGIFMIDAGLGCVKDGFKNRLREQDMRKIVDVFDGRLELPNYSRIVPLQEIGKAEYNLNVVRYIAAPQSAEYRGRVDARRREPPVADRDALGGAWSSCARCDVPSFGPAPEAKS
jgi:type I restriction enzyme M protein